MTVVPYRPAAASPNAVEVPERVDGGGPLLVLCDHASNSVPADIDLGISADLLGRHIAYDIGAAALTRAIAAATGAPALLGTVSRLVVDLHRPPDHAGLIPLSSDGHPIPGNAHADRLARIARFHAPYHRAIARAVTARRPALIAAIHSFTPALETVGAPRPWPIGILYNRDTRAARMAIDRLTAAGLLVGDNQPYSGRDLNMTLNRHGEANGIASLAIEVRNDEIASPEGVARWCAILTPLLRDLADRYALVKSPPACERDADQMPPER